MQDAPKHLCLGCGLYYGPGPKAYRKHMNSDDHYILAMHNELADTDTEDDRQEDTSKPIPDKDL